MFQAFERLFPLVHHVSRGKQDTTDNHRPPAHVEDRVNDCQQRRDEPDRLKPAGSRCVDPGEQTGGEVRGAQVRDQAGDLLPDAKVVENVCDAAKIRDSSDEVRNDHRVSNSLDCKHHVENPEDRPQDAGSVHWLGKAGRCAAFLWRSRREPCCDDECGSRDECSPPCSDYEPGLGLKRVEIHQARLKEREGRSPEEPVKSYVIKPPAEHPPPEKDGQNAGKERECYSHEELKSGRPSGCLTEQRRAALVLTVRG